MGVKLEVSDIGAAHELRKGMNDSVSPLVVRFTYTTVKQDVMAARKKLRDVPGPVYFNDQMTVTNGRIFGKARHLRKEGTIYAVWTVLGKVFIKRAENSPSIWIKNMNML